VQQNYRDQLTTSTIRRKIAWGKTSPEVSVASISSSYFGSQIFELTMYLDSDPITIFDDKFDILSWWHEQKANYGIMSLLDCDFLTVPVSTISLESIFTIADRFIERR
jgi:hypothetical protein